MSGSLANRLVEVATNAADKAEVEVYADRRLTRADLRFISESVTAAVIRELSAHLREVSNPKPWLDELAEVVEKGEQT